MLIEECDDIIGIIFAITSTELYVPVVTFFIDDNIKFSKIIKQGFKRTTSLNKYRPEITTQSKNNNWGCLIDLTFKKINALFAHSFENGNNNPTRYPFNKYYMPLVEIKDFNAIINNKPFFDHLLKIKPEAFEKNYWNIKKWWVYGKKFIRLFALYQICWIY